VGCTREEGEEENPTDAFENNLQQRTPELFLPLGMRILFHLESSMAFKNFMTLSSHLRIKDCGNGYGSSRGVVEIRSDQGLLKHAYHLGQQLGSIS